LLFNCVTPEILTQAIAQAVQYTDVQVCGYANFWEESDRTEWVSDTDANDQKCCNFIIRNDLTNEKYLEYA